MNECEKDTSAEELYSFIREYAILKLDDETKRYESLIRQASNMQAAFSFSTAALFMVATIAVDNKGKMSYEYLLLVFTSITFFLLLSLLCACLAQSRGKLQSFADIHELEHFVQENYEAYLPKGQREKAMAEQIGEVQFSASEKNNEMANRIKLSMYFFYVAMALSVFWFIVSLVILFY